MTAALLLAASFAAAAPAPVWTAKGLAEPESVAYDQATASLYVTNFAGKPAVKDGVGFISKLDLTGKVVKLQWVSGLNAPGGIKSCGGRLYVADIDELVIIGIAKAKVEKRVKAPNAAFLNDVAVDGKCTAYVSDMFKSAIYRFAPDALVWLDGPALDSPNGLYLQGGKLVAASWGLTKDGSTTTPGKLRSYDLATKKGQPLNGPGGNLDGVERHKTWWLATDWVNGTLLRSAPNGATTVVMHGLEGPADILALPEKGWLLLPEMKKGTLSAYRLMDVAP